MMIQSGQIVHGYEMLERIGSGGFGAVYRAYQSTVGREVAVKIILPAYANKPEFIRRFELEAQLVACLEHLHIVPLYDYWRDPNGAYIVMRWLRGGSLHAALRNCAFGLEAASALLDQVASGLAAAHFQNIVHRDLKPSNILLDEEGNAYLADFGIARDLSRTKGSDGGSDGSNRLDIEGGESILGSIQYLSPEQLLGQKATPQSDIYSLGITLYEMLCGQHPFPGLNSVQQLYKHIDEPLPWIETLDGEVAEGVNKVIQKATAKNPKRRFQDALAMAAAFRDAARVSQEDQTAELVESLTRREQEILHLIIAGNTNQQIAQMLYLELSTVKWHINRIYKKLGVRSRVQAIVRARDLNLIVSTDDIDAELAQKTSISIALPEPVNPYKGLRAFEAADTRDFFGREALVEQLLSRLATNGSQRFLAIVGPSGSGKSSLIKAGLIPALWSGRLAGSDKWFIVEMLPGARPLDNLEIALTRIAADQAGNLRGHLERDSLGLGRAARLILPNDESELVLVIDQFEELFTLVEDEGPWDHFLDLIHGAVTDPGSRVRVIIALRADYYDRPLQYPAFGEQVRGNLETLLPLSAEELERALVNPAQQAGVTFEPGLVATIIEDVSYRPGALPLLQFALAELFEQRDGRMLTQKAYQALGGAAGALAKRAEELYQEQDTEGREAIRQMFLRLVSVGDQMTGIASDVSSPADTRRRVLRSEMLSAASDPERLDEIIDTYADYRLLSLDHDPGTRQGTVEVAHEAILGEWERLQSWLEESRADLNLHRQLVQATREWIEAGGDQSFLLRGARLDRFESWISDAPLVLTRDESAFLAASLAHSEEIAAAERSREQEKARLEQSANRRLKQLVVGLVLGLVIAIGLTIAAVSFARRADEQRQIAEQQQRLSLARELGAAAIDNLEKDPELSILLALESIDMTFQIDGIVLPELENLLHMAVQADRTEVTIPMVGFVAFSPDGASLAIGSSTGALKIWDTMSGEEIIQLDGHTSLIGGLTFSPEGRFLASASFDGRVKIWDVATGKRIASIIGHEGQTNDAVFSPDGRQLVTVAPDAVRIWDTTILYDLSSGGSVPYEISEPALIRLLPDGANTVAMSHDGQRIAVIKSGLGIQVWDSNLEEQVLEISDVSDYASSAAFSPTGDYLAGGSGDLGVTLWNADTGEEVLFLPEDAPITSVAFDQDGRLLATAAKNGMIALWDLDNRVQTASILGQSTGFNFMALSPDGGRVAAGSSPKSTSIWDVSPTGSREQLTIAAHEGRVYDAVYNPAGSKIASTGEDGALRLWDASTGELLHDLPAQREWVHFPAFSPDGERLAAVNRKGGITIWDADKGEELLTVYGEASAFSAIAFSPDGSRFAAAGKGGIAHIWDVVTGQQLTTIENHNGISITELVYGLDGDHIFSYDLQGITRAWDGETGEQLISLSAGMVCEATLWDAELSLDGRIQAMASFDGFAYVLHAVGEPETQLRYVLLHDLSGHEGVVTGVAFNPQGTVLASSGFDGTARLWDIDQGVEISTLTNQPLPLEGVDFSPDGRHVVTAGDDGKVKVYVVSIEELMEVARSRLSRGFTQEECQRYLHRTSCVEG